ncbi:MAG: sugar phosphate nucleotidyltransferase [Syntrophomonadaceae bacterium]|nr:sugar phosphate nucleotidyltransferase [Syntrophomonadaceae bacterium]
MISVILAGGKGVRLWPESTEKRPKQFCDFMGRGSLLNMTLQRLQSLGKLMVVCGDEQKTPIEAEKNGIEFTVLTEPMGRNTAAAVGLVLASDDYDHEEVLGIFPADHYIENDQEFGKLIHKAEELAKEGYLVTIGITPAYAETGYGYIERFNEEDSNLVKAFHEKPDLETALSYVKNGNFFWNAGIFLATVKKWLGLMEEHLPALYEKMQEGTEAYRADYPNYPNISIDYAIAEKCKKMAVLEGDFGWNDIGSWGALAAVLDQDEQGNALVGDASAIESSGCLGRSSHKKLILFGVDDLVVVESEDTILVCPKNRSQDIRQVVEYIQVCIDRTND